MSEALEMIMGHYPKHTEKTKEKVLKHIDEYVLEDISSTELISLARHLLLRDWLSMSKESIEADLEYYEEKKK